MLISMEPAISTGAIHGRRTDERDAAGVGLWAATSALWHRELVRFVRQPTRVVEAVATPAAFWLLLGLGLTGSFTPGGTGGAGASYLSYFFPGTVLLILLFTAVFSTISVVEERREGVLQGVLAAPIPRLAIVLGKVLGGATVAAGQAVLFLLLWPLVLGRGGGEVWGGMAMAAGVVVLLGVMFSCGGLLLAWGSRSAGGFHAVMMLVLMPLWLLSGAVFPLHEGTPTALKALMLANPMTYAHAALAGPLLGEVASSPIGWPLGLAVTVAVTAAALAVAVVRVGRG